MFANFLSRLIQRPYKPAAVWDGGPGSCVLLIDMDGKVAGLSDGAPVLLGRTRAATGGVQFAALFIEDDRDRAMRALSKGAPAGRTSAHIRFPSGETRPVEFLIRSRPDGLRAVLIVDAQGRTDVDKGSAALAAEVDAARAEAKAKADLLADLSHEMRTPLNAVIGFAEAMSGETFGPLGHDKYGEYAEHIRASGGHLLDLVSSILDLSKIEADRFALKPELVDAGAIAKECVAMVRLSAEEAGLKLTTEIADDLPESWLDARAVRQILINLLSNAVKFTSDGEIKLTASAAGDEIVLTVTDTGVGMSEAELKKLGARFTAAHGDGVRGTKGAGLGLALAFALAELHGGAMTLASAPGEGMKAIVRLPVKAGAAPVRLCAMERTVVLQAAPANVHTHAPASSAGIQTQLDRIEAYRRERAANAA